MTSAEIVKIYISYLSVHPASIIVFAFIQGVRIMCFAVCVLHKGAAASHRLPCTLYGRENHHPPAASVVRRNGAALIGRAAASRARDGCGSLIGSESSVPIGLHHASPALHLSSVFLETSVPRYIHVSSLVDITFDRIRGTLIIVSRCAWINMPLCGWR